jgi:hypothetical protein
MGSDDEKSAEASAKLIGDLTVGDARHILACEGGKLTLAQFLFQFATVVAISTLTAWALLTGRATAWHLALPIIAQYLAVMTAVPLIYLVMPHPEMRKEVVQAVWVWIGLAATAAIAAVVRSWWSELPWHEQLPRDMHAAWKWITDAHMHWPIMAAFVLELVAIPGRVRNLHVYGPPFVPISLGCGMYFVVLMFGCVVLPLTVESSGDMAWALWWMILIAELLTLWMLVDLQHSLGKYDRQERPPS